MRSRIGPHDERLYQQSVRDIKKFMDGKPSTYTRIELPRPATKQEIKATRKKLAATQRGFAEVVGVSLETVKAWEAGKRVPEGPATKIIKMLSRKPSAVSVLQ